MTRPVLVVLSASVLLFLMAGCGVKEGAKAAVPAQTATRKNEPMVVLPDRARIVVEVVADPVTRAQGLMYRPSLSSDRGMLFLFPERAVYPFWMKNTLIPLDIAWIDENGVVIDVMSDVPPCAGDPCTSYTPSGEAVSVLELAAGTASAHGLKRGDVLAFEGIENIVAR